MQNKPEDLWVQVLKGKYSRGEQGGSNLDAKPGDSKLWKDLSRIDERMAPLVSQQDHKLIWNPSSFGQFTVASAYNALLQIGDGSRHNVWKIIWQLHVPERVKVFMWLSSAPSKGLPQGN